jgi:hypothetical protein
MKLGAVNNFVLVITMVGVVTYKLCDWWEVVSVLWASILSPLTLTPGR